LAKAAGLAACAIIGLVTGAQAQKFPEKPVRLISPFAPGGGTDILGRIIAQGFTELWGTNMIVENRSGASGNIGADYVAKGVPVDGYTLLLGVNSYTINSNVQKHMPFDLVKDLAPVGMIVTSPLVLTVNEKVPAKNVAELIALVKANPGKFSHGSAGSATAPHLAGELFNIMAGTDILHVPYRGSGPVIPALLANEVQMGFGPLNSVEGFARQGQLRVIAALGAARWPGLPDVPTVAESGLPGFGVDLWYALFAPARTPMELVERLNADLRRVLEMPAVAESLTQKGFQPAASTPETLAETIRKDLARWKSVTSKVDVQID
jgi:tripartite-type tricarboxylate transporter receptor subunit TctC